MRFLKYFKITNSNKFSSPTATHTMMIREGFIGHDNKGRITTLGRGGKNDTQNTTIYDIRYS